MKHPTVCTWANVDEGCPITYSVDGSNMAHLVIGDNQLEVGFDAESLRALVSASTAALAEMDARFEHEEAARAAEGNTLPAGCSA
jgi:hypothetical protein